MTCRNCLFILRSEEKSLRNRSVKKWLKIDFTEILEVNLFAFAYRLFHEDLSPIYDEHLIYIMCVRYVIHFTSDVCMTPVPVTQEVTVNACVLLYRHTLTSARRKALRSNGGNQTSAVSSLL